MKNDGRQLRKIDLHLLQLLQKNALLTSQQLGDEVSLSPTAAKRRVNRMRETGIIQRDVSIVEPQSLGYSFFTLVMVNLERDKRNLLENFKRRIQSNPRILQAFYITGDADFIVLVASKDLAHYEQFTQQFFGDDLNLKQFKTMVVLDTIKLSTELPIDIENGTE